LQNRIKRQAHDHQRFRAFAARYGQAIHQLNMRLNVALLRNVDAELKAKDKAEAPTVKTKEEVEKEEAAKAKQAAASKEAQPQQDSRKSVWKRRFRPLPEAKAVDLFADVVGDAFVLGVGVALVLYEYYRQSQKPDANAEKIKALDEKLEELKQREAELEEAEERQRSRLKLIEDALQRARDPKTKLPLLQMPTQSPA
jgi:optic atrophy 3 protein